MAADIRAEADGEGDDPDHAGGLVQEWMDTVGKGVPGYVTPKVAVGAAVGNDKGELLLIQRADSGIWLYPTGWCDVGYSAAEVVVKEVEEETGIIAEPVRLIAVLDGLRLGFTRVPLYSLLFYCRAVGGELAPHPLETRDVGWFTRETLPQPLVGSDRWGEHVFAAINGERRDVLYDSVRQPMWRGELDEVVITGRGRRVGRRRPLRGGRPPRCPSSRRSAPPPTPCAAGTDRGRPRHHALRGRGRRADRRHADPGHVRDPDGRARPGSRTSWSTSAARGKGVAAALVQAALDRVGRHRRPNGRPDVAARPRGRQPPVPAHGLRAAHDERLPPDARGPGLVTDAQSPHGDMLAPPAPLRRPPPAQCGRGNAAGSRRMRRAKVGVKRPSPQGRSGSLAKAWLSTPTMRVETR